MFITILLFLILRTKLEQLDSANMTDNLIDQVRRTI